MLRLSLSAAQSPVAGSSSSLLQPSLSWGSLKNYKNPLALSSLLEPRPQTQTCQPSMHSYQQPFPSPRPARQVTGTGPSKHSLQGTAVQPQAWNGCNLPRTLPRRKAAQCSVCSRCQEDRSLDASRQHSQENKLSALSASPPATHFLLLLPSAFGRDVPQAPCSWQGEGQGDPGLYSPMQSPKGVQWKPGWQPTIQR